MATASSALIRGLRAHAIYASPTPAEAPPPSGPSASFLTSFWGFLRPHTIRGTVLGSCAVTVRAVAENPGLLDWGLLPRAMLGLLVLLAGNGYIVGINQVYDVDIDAMNKPWLPIPAGAFSLQMAWGLCLLMAGVGLGLCLLLFSPAIVTLYVSGLLLGTLYSVPPLRLKRFPVAALLTIACVRGFLLNVGVYHAVRCALGLRWAWSPAIVFITAFTTVFAAAIAMTKDLPDAAGDRAHGIETFATRWGQRQVAWLGTGLLLANYAAGCLAAATRPALLNAPLVLAGHAAAAAALTWRTLRLEDGAAGVAAYYRFVWYLFYAEYALLPFL